MKIQLPKIPKTIYFTKDLSKFIEKQAIENGRSFSSEVEMLLIKIKINSDNMPKGKRKGN